MYQLFQEDYPCLTPRQAKGLDLSFPLLCDNNGATAKAYGAYLELEEQGAMMKLHW
jgi:peroxiredoxin